MKKLMERMKKNNKKGFTLVELICVVVLLAILAMVAVPAYTKVQDAAAQRVAGANARTNYSIGKANEALLLADNKAVNTDEMVTSKEKLEKFVLGTDENGTNPVGGYTAKLANDTTTTEKEPFGFWKGSINGTTWYSVYSASNGLCVSKTGFEYKAGETATPDVLTMN